MNQTKQQNISSGLEDYIETVYIAGLKNEQLKGAELARRLKISRASVSEALAKLVTMGMISYNRYEFICLTEIGKAEAMRVYRKHHILQDFFENVLGVTPEEAEENACKIEHIVSENILNRMSDISDFFKKHENLSDIYTKGK